MRYPHPELPVAHLLRLQGMVHADAMHALRTLRDVGREHGVDLYLAGGAVRALVWDAMYGVPASRPSDLDVGFFHPDELLENVIQRELDAASPWLPWEVRNQVRMHYYNSLPPFVDFHDAIAHWVDTPSAVAIRLRGNTPLDIEVVAPYGLYDLFDGRVRVSPGLAWKKESVERVVRERVTSKKWLERWPELKIDL